MFGELLESLIKKTRMEISCQTWGFRNNKPNRERKPEKNYLFKSQNRNGN